MQRISKASSCEQRYRVMVFVSGLFYEKARSPIPALLPCLILLRLFVSRALPSMETICGPHRKKFESAVIRGLCAHIFQPAFIAKIARVLSILCSAPHYGRSRCSLQSKALSYVAVSGGYLRR